jgi:hypothetical protein
VSPPRILVYGLGVSGIATATRLLAEGAQVVAADDDTGTRPGVSAARLGIDLVQAPDGTALAGLASSVDEIVVSPGVPACPPVFSLAGTLPVVGEIELAWRRARCPIVAITGTNGKTTVTTLVQAMLEASGRVAVAAGNIGLPLLDAVGGEAEVIVAEVSSFQLALTTSFCPAVGAWLNFSADHLDWHATVETPWSWGSRPCPGPGAPPCGRSVSSRGTTPCAPGSSSARTGRSGSGWTAWPAACRMTWSTPYVPWPRRGRGEPASRVAGRRWARFVGSPIA